MQKFCLLCHTGFNEFHIVTYLLSTAYNSEPTATYKCSLVPVIMEGCKELQFKQHAVVEFMTADKIPPTNIHCHMQAVYQECNEEMFSIGIGGDYVRK